MHVTARHHGKRRGVVFHRARSLTEDDVTVHHDIPVTTPARTLIDLADVLSPKALEKALAEAQIRGLIAPGEIPFAPGRRLVARDAAPTRSQLERDFLAFLDAHDLPRPVVNGRVHGFEVDAHWPDARLIVELDGYAYHGTRHAFHNDRERDAILQAAGWSVIRITARQLHRATATRLQRLLRPAPARAPA